MVNDLNEKPVSKCVGWQLLFVLQQVVISFRARIVKMGLLIVI